MQRLYRKYFKKSSWNCTKKEYYDEKTGQKRPKNDVFFVIFSRFGDPVCAHRGVYVVPPRMAYRVSPKKFRAESCSGLEYPVPLTFIQNFARDADPLLPKCHFRASYCRQKSICWCLGGSRLPLNWVGDKMYGHKKRAPWWGSNEGF